MQAKKSSPRKISLLSPLAGEGLGVKGSILAALAIALVFTSNAVAQSSQSVRVPATVEGIQSADLYAKLGGFVKTVSVDIGDTVKQGQILAEIDAPEMEKQLAQKKSMLALAKAQVEQAKAKIEEAKSKLDALDASVTEASTIRAQKEAKVAFERTECNRIAQLVGSGSVKSSLLDAARFKLSAAESELQSVDAKVATAGANLSGGNSAVRSAQADVVAAEANVGVAKANVDYVIQMINYSKIRAPWPGEVTRRMVDPGAFVRSAADNSGAMPLFRIVGKDKVIVAFSLSQKQLAGLKKGTKVTFGDVEALPDQKFEGSVARFSSEMDPGTRMMRVEMELENADGKLKPGFFGYATLAKE